MSIGMSYKEYWDESPMIARDYYKAEQLRIENQNTMAWLQGVYIHEAFEVGLANFGQSLANKHGKNIQYRDKPIRITPKTVKEIKQEQEEARAKYIASLKAWQESFERRGEKNNE